MIKATRSATEKKAPEAPARPVEAPRPPGPRPVAPVKQTELTGKGAPDKKVDQAEVSREASTEQGADDHEVLARVRARVNAGAEASEPGADNEPSTDQESGIGGAAGAAGKALEEPLTPEEQALENLDRYSDLYDNPGEVQDPDGKISEDDLEDVAGGNYDRDAARAYLEAQGVAPEDVDERLMEIEESARYLQENEELRNELDTGNDGDADPDGIISRGDISSVILERQGELAQEGNLPPGESASNRDSYEEVETMDERSPEVIERQEAAVLEALATGEPVEFTNANGQTETLSINQVESSGGKAVYEIMGEDGHTIRVTSDLGATENRTALARLADYYSQLPPGVRDSVSQIDLLQRVDEDAAADYRSGNDHVRFYDGLANLNEEVFNHEYGHGIGYTESDKDNGFLGIGGTPDGSPEGWQDAIEADSGQPSDYSDTNHKEDFAESWAAYLEAREQGPEALEQLMEAYPSRFEILERIYEEAAA